MNLRNAKTLATVERERERERATLYLKWEKSKNVIDKYIGKITTLFNSLTHTLFLLKDKSLIILGLISVEKKLYIKYKEIKVDMQLLHGQTVF